MPGVTLNVNLGLGGDDVSVGRGGRWWWGRLWGSGAEKTLDLLLDFAVNLKLP